MSNTPRNLLLAGVDEAGRGPLAGPLAVASVILKPGVVIDGIRDSKKLKHETRLKLSQEIRAKALAYSCILISPDKIDHFNILQATKMGMRQTALQVIDDLGLSKKNNIHFLVDGNAIFCKELSVEAIIKGDDKLQCIGAASILAKVTRDLYMEKVAEEFPQYEFQKHKGYPTKLHKELIRTHGPCPIHRKTFAGVKEHLDKSTKNISSNKGASF